MRDILDIQGAGQPDMADRQKTDRARINSSMSPAEKARLGLAHRCTASSFVACKVLALGLYHRPAVRDDRIPPQKVDATRV